MGVSRSIWSLRRSTSSNPGDRNTKDVNVKTLRIIGNGRVLSPKSEAVTKKSMSVTISMYSVRHSTKWHLSIRSFQLDAIQTLLKAADDGAVCLFHKHISTMECHKTKHMPCMSRLTPSDFRAMIALLFSELCHTQYWLRWTVFVKKTFTVGCTNVEYLFNIRYPPQAPSISLLVSLESHCESQPILCDSLARITCFSINLVRMFDWTDLRDLSHRF